MDDHTNTWSEKTRETTHPKLRKAHLAKKEDISQVRQTQLRKREMS